MNTFFNYPAVVLHRISEFFSVASRRWLAAVIILVTVTAIGALQADKVRRSFTFLDAEGMVVLEIRYLPRSADLESGLALYVAEFLLGPADPLGEPWFRVGAGLESAFERSGQTYVNLSADAALPPPGAASLRPALAALESGILRNFPTLKSVFVSIGGREAYAEAPAPSDSPTPPDDPEKN